MADDALAEALSRIEHKLDLLLEMVIPLAGPKFFQPTPVGDINHVCPVCTQQVQYAADIMRKVILRQCKCSTGKIAPIDLSLFAPPIQTKKETNNGGEDTEDRGDTTSGRGNRRR